MLALRNPNGDDTPQQPVLALEWKTASPTPAPKPDLELDERLWTPQSKSAPSMQAKKIHQGSPPKPVSKKRSPSQEPKRQYPNLLALPLVVVCCTPFLCGMITY
jgi:hypothetical protein